MSGTQSASTEGRKRRTLLLLTGLAVGMFGFGFAMVPLYGLLCQVTGVQSVGRRVAIDESDRVTSPAQAEDRWVTVKLDATVHPDLPWVLEPMQRKLRVRPGESYLVNFIAENRSGSSITAQAIPSIAPWQATGFLSKMECFCFSQQTLSGNERTEMPLRFSVSPDLPADINSLTLSYSVLRISQPDSLAAAN